MKKAKFLMFILIIAAAMPFLTVDLQARRAVRPSTARVLLNGRQVDFLAYNIDGYNFFRLRDIAYVLSSTSAHFEVTWNDELSRINLLPGQPYTPVGVEMAQTTAMSAALPTTANILLQNEPIDLRAYNIGGSNFFRLVDLGYHLGFGIEWNPAAATISIDTNEPVLSEFGRQAAEIFLSRFPSIFSFGFRISEGVYTTLDSVPLSAPPLVYYDFLAGGAVYRDYAGNIIDDAVFLLEGALIAFEFRLFRVENDPMPAILISFGYPETDWIVNVLYRFSEGDFRKAEMIEDIMKDRAFVQEELEIRMLIKERLGL